MKKKLGILMLGICLFASSCSTEGKKDNNSTSSTISQIISNTNSSSVAVNSSSNVSSSSSSTIVVPENPRETVIEINNYLKSLIPDIITEDLFLPAYLDKYDIEIIWNTSNINILDSTGVFYKPVEDTSLMISVEYTYKELVNKFYITTVAQGCSEQDIVDISKELLVKPIIDLENTVVNLEKQNSKYGSSITWTISNNEFITLEDYVLTVSEDAFLEGTSFILTAEIKKNDTVTTTDFHYDILPDKNLQVQKIASLITKPEIINNSYLDVPLSSEYNSTITWTANDQDVIIDDGHITLPKYEEQWTLLIKGLITIGDAQEEISFNYQVAADPIKKAQRLAEDIESLPIRGNATLEDKAKIDEVKADFDNLNEEQRAAFNELPEAQELIFKLEDLLDKYLEVRNIETVNGKVTWKNIEIATGYEITFTDINKVFTVDKNEFIFANYGIPTDSTYNVSIKVLTEENTDYIAVGDSITKFGEKSNLEKVPYPIITINGTTSFKWDANYYETSGATKIRVYVDGILHRELPVSIGEYLYRQNGVAELNEQVSRHFAIQFIGNGITHQTSDFYVFDADVKGHDTKMLDATTIAVDSGQYLRLSKVDYNKGYEVRIDDFRAYFTEYNVRIEDKFVYIPLCDLNLPAGTYTVKARAYSDSGSTPSPWSKTIKLTVKEDVTPGIDMFNYDADTLTISWGSMTNVFYYHIQIPSLGVDLKTTDLSYDLGLVDNLYDGTHQVIVSYCSYQKKTSLQGAVNHSIKSTYDINITLSSNKLNAPINIVGTYDDIIWDAVEGATSYEVVVNGTSYYVDTNRFVFIEHELTRCFEYNVKIKAIGATVVDNSFYSDLIEVNYEFENVALSSLGATIETNDESYVQDPYNAIDGLPTSRWESSSIDGINLVITLDQEYTIYGFYVSWEAANAAKYNIEVSTDGETWEKVFEYSGTSVQEARDDYAYLNQEVNVKYIRINCITRGTNYGYSLYSFEALILKN